MKVAQQEGASLMKVPGTHPPLIVILTDFGVSDPFVGIMKGVINSIAPQAQMIDLTHEIPPGDVRRGAVTLWQSKPYFRPGTIFLCVVDPGVGTARRPVLVESTDLIFIGPDNGLFSFVVGEDYRAWELRNSKLALSSPRMTFHGRDVFAPAAAHVAVGVAGSEFGPPAGSLTRLSPPLLNSTAPGNLQGEVLFSDRFGNLITSLGKFVPVADGSFQLDPWISEVGMGVVREGSERRYRPEDYRLHLPGGGSLGWVSTFAEAPLEGCAFLVGSSGLLEIVADRKSAAQLLGLRPGDTVILSSHGER